MTFISISWSPLHLHHLHPIVGPGHLTPDPLPLPSYPLFLFLLFPCLWSLHDHKKDLQGGQIPPCLAPSWSPCLVCWAKVIHDFPRLPLQPHLLLSSIETFIPASLTACSFMHLGNFFLLVLTTLPLQLVLPHSYLLFSQSIRTILLILSWVFPILMRLPMSLPIPPSHHCRVRSGHQDGCCLDLGTSPAPPVPVSHIPYSHDWPSHLLAHIPASDCSNL